MIKSIKHPVRELHHALIKEINGLHFPYDLVGARTIISVGSLIEKAI